MDITFGIITSGTVDNYIDIIISSIEQLNIPNYEIIIIGNSSICRKNTIVIPFDETIKPLWITKKKNIITKLAKYDNIVYQHDYITYNINWYNGLLKMENFDVCVTKMVNTDNTRYRDWILLNGTFNNIEIPNQYRLLPYENIKLRYIHISGAFWVAKKEFMLANPLNENLVWGDGEDVEWSYRIANYANIILNQESSNHLLYWKDTFLQDIGIIKYSQIKKLLEIK